MKYYKALRMNLGSWHDEKFIWSLKKAIIQAGAVAGDPCGIGLHLAKSLDVAFQYAKFPARLFEAKPLSEILGEDTGKVRVAQAQLVRELRPYWLRRTNVFIEGIAKIRWFDNHLPPRKEWKIFETWDAAWDVARNVARNAPWDAVGDATRDAELFVRACVALPAKSKHWKHIKARWDVWERGYGLLCDVDGTLYVYKKP